MRVFCTEGKGEGGGPRRVGWHDRADRYGMASRGRESVPGQRIRAHQTHPLCFPSHFPGPDRARVPHGASTSTTAAFQPMVPPPPPPFHTFQVLTTLGYLMEPVPAPLQPFSRWYRLTRRRSSDRISGEIMVIVGVMPGYVHDAVRGRGGRRQLLADRRRPSSALICSHLPLPDINLANVSIDRLSGVRTAPTSWIHSCSRYSVNYELSCELKM